MKVPFSYLDRQFSDIDLYLADIRQFVQTGDFTLGAALTEFETRFAALHGAPHGIGVGTGTDAIAMSLKVLGIGAGDEVITCANTFVATIGAIVQTGATPVLVDSENGFVIDVDLVEAAITPKTKAIVPVHYTGNVADMPRLADIAARHGLVVVEDACQAIRGSIDGQPVGSWGRTAAFSLHPLKNLNVWGDGGMIVTHSAELAEKLRLYRNHGLQDRDTVTTFGINCRLDTLQAVIGNRLLADVHQITAKRQANARFYDHALADLAGSIDIPSRRPGVDHVFHLYVVRAQKRDELLAFLNANGIEAKIHYPVPMHLQPAAAYLGYRPGDFPVTETHSSTAITLPAHQHLDTGELDYAAEKVRDFYKGRGSCNA